MTNLILGAGVTGLTAGHKTGWPIYESTTRPGGLCQSYYNDGFRFEVGGGHWIFGHAQIMKFIGRFSPLRFYSRRSGVYFNMIVPYPLQGYLNDDDMVVPKGTMKDWLYGQFGVAQSKLFFFPFHEKYTAGLYSQIIPTDKYKTPMGDSRGYNEVFAYPVHGLDHFVHKLAEGQDIHYGCHARKIDLEKHIIKFDNGQEIEYDRIISTIPLSHLLSMAGIEHELPYTSVWVCNFGGDPGPEMPSEHWLYVPSPQEPLHRVGFYSNVEPSFSPVLKKGVYVETAFAPDSRPLYRTWEAAYETLKRWGWMGRLDIFQDHIIDVAYTWQTKNSKVEKHLEFLEDHDVVSIGRYGKWKFQGIAQSIEDGLNVTES